MKKNKLSESKIIELLKRIEKGADIETTIREYGISTSTYYILKNGSIINITKSISIW
jgi:putative transposase